MSISNDLEADNWNLEFPWILEFGDWNLKPEAS
jgi:hypothetical protein